jgi:hypothetical protein
MRGRRGEEAASYGKEVAVAGYWPAAAVDGPITWMGTGFDSSSSSDPDSMDHVPPLIHQIWDDEVVENTCQISAQSWERFCEQYNCVYKLWRRSDLESLAPFVNREYYMSASNPQMRADIARYEILNKHGGLYLDCDMIWVGKSRMSDTFVSMLNHAQLALTASNDITNAVGQSNLSLAVVFFTNRVMATSPQHPVLVRTIEMVSQQLVAFTKEASEVEAKHGKNAKQSKHAAKERPFHTTGPYILNQALQESGDSALMQVIPGKWIYPETLENHNNLVMFGHQKNREIHKTGVAVSDSTGWNTRPWLMHKSMPNYFTIAQRETSRYAAEDYTVLPPSGSKKKGAVTVFLHHNKAGGTGVKVALQQLYKMSSNLSHANIFSTNACAYSSAAITRNLHRDGVPAFCSSETWAERHLPACGRCKASASMDVKLAADQPPLVFDQSPDGSKGAVATAVCFELKRGGRCDHSDLKGHCCKTCGAAACPQINKPVVGNEITPSGLIGAAATKRCSTLKAAGECGSPELRGFCCKTCGETSCATANMLVGDYAMGVCKIVAPDRPCAYYTMLREPRARIASSYLHCQYEPDDQLCMTHILDARHATFAQWVAHQGNYLLRQLVFDISSSLSIEEQYEMYIQYTEHKLAIAQLHQSNAWLKSEGDADMVASDLKGVPHVATGTLSEQKQGEPAKKNADLSPIEKSVLQYKPNLMWLLEQQRGKSLSDADAEIILESLESLFAVIGIVEKFNESLAMFETVFKLPFVNASQMKTKSQANQQMHVHEGEDISNRKMVQEGMMQQFVDNPELDSLIKWDLRLYARALEIFRKQEIALWEMNKDMLKVYGPADTLDGKEGAVVPTGGNGPIQEWFSKLKHAVGGAASTAAPTTVPAAVATTPLVVEDGSSSSSITAEGSVQDDAAGREKVDRVPPPTVRLNAAPKQAPITPRASAAPALAPILPDVAPDGTDGGMEYDDEVKIAQGLEEISLMRNAATLDA